MVDHKGGAVEPVAARIVASWDIGSFVENLAVDANGQVFVSIHNQNAIVRCDPATGHLSPFVTLPAPVAGLAFDATGVLWAAGGEIGSGVGHVWRIENSVATAWTTITGAQFVNGIAVAPGHRLLVADSILGCVHAVRIDRPEVSVWLRDPRLQPNPGSQTPGANGIKLFAGHATISVTDGNCLMRCAVGRDGAAGPLSLLADDLRADDMAFDQAGNTYIATHPMNSVVRLSPAGGRTTLGGPAEGLVGATAVAFGRGPDVDALFVTTTGGILAPFEGKPQRAKLVRLDIGVPGDPLPHTST